MRLRRKTQLSQFRSRGAAARAHRPFPFLFPVPDLQACMHHRLKVQGFLAEGYDEGTVHKSFAKRPEAVLLV